jgi:hypothetical protein
MQVFDGDLRPYIVIKTYQSENGTWGYMIKIDGRVRGGDTGFPSEQHALAGSDEWRDE